MGVNNRQRRAAKQRRRRERRGGRSGPRVGPDPFGDPGRDEAEAYADVEHRVSITLTRLRVSRYDDERLHREVEALLDGIRPQPPHVAGVILGGMLDRLVRGVADGGWERADLVELVRRHAGTVHVPTLLAVLGEGRLVLDTVERMASGLRVAALLMSVPLLDADSLPPTSTTSTGGRAEHPKLAQVRALLAKAESTDYDEEAEALSAKAQELISRYSLDQLVASATGGRQQPGSTVEVRRLWLDPPYLSAKAMLVHEVAAANRCRTASSKQLGFCVVVGSQPDLDAIELLVTSLLVQADRAMLRHGRRSDWAGRSRTRSFRQSFLVSYAVRIGERLRAASEEAAAIDEERLLPVLRNHEVAVSEAFDALVPHTVGRSARVTNGEGWAAGAAAADLARLDVHGKLDGRSAG